NCGRGVRRIAERAQFVSRGRDSECGRRCFGAWASEVCGGRAAGSETHGGLKGFQEFADRRTEMEAKKGGNAKKANGNVQGGANGSANDHTNTAANEWRVKVGLAEMLKGGVIMDVTNAEQAKIAEKAGACAVMALERVPSDIRKEGGVARM